MGTAYFDIAAGFLLILNLYLFYARSRLFISQTKVFLVLIYITLFTVAADILGVALYRNAAEYPRWLHLLVNTLYYTGQNSIAPTFLFFVLAISGLLDKMKTAIKPLALIPWFASMAIIIPTFRTGFAFSFDDELNYTRGQGLHFLYAIALLYVILGLVLLIAERRRTSRDVFLSVALFLPFSLVPFVVQYFLPHLLIQNLGVAVSELFILLTIQDFGRYIDPKTKLFNRNGLTAQLEVLVSKGKPFSVFIVSFDTADFLLHALGSDAFSRFERVVADSLFGPMRESHFAAQTAPGKFVYAVTDAARAAEAREHIESRFTRAWELDGRPLSVSARLCEFRIPDETPDLRKIFQVQYQLSRYPGRFPPNTVLSLDDMLLTDTGRRQVIEHAIRTTILSSGFQLFYQPIISVSSGRIRTAEALLRLDHPELGWIPPAEFIPIAEQHGSIHRIGDIVIDLACGFLVSIREAGLDLEYIEVNLSAMQCIQSNLADRLLAAVRRFHLNPSDLYFEITETSANLSPVLMKKNIEALSQAGFSIVIDDFGKGYSNIAGLMETPFKVVKLDRSLLLSMEHGSSGRTAFEGLVTMFKHMDAELVAEGIERVDQLETVVGMGIDLIQGFYYSRPLPPDQFLAFLRERGSVCT